VIAFVDTSAFYAVLDADDDNHQTAKETWITLLRQSSTLFTTNYVLLETAALLQHRIGLTAVRSFHEDVVPLLQVEYVTEEMHRSGVEAVLAAGRKRLSLVDCVSFQVMRQLGIRDAFCFAAHFAEQGFTTRLAGKTR